MKDNFRVVVYPRHPGNFVYASIPWYQFMSQEEYEKEMMDRCEEMAEQIRCHVDYVDVIEIEWDDDEEPTLEDKLYDFKMWLKDNGYDEVIEKGKEIGVW